MLLKSPLFLEHFPEGSATSASYEELRNNLMPEEIAMANGNLTMLEAVYGELKEGMSRAVVVDLARNICNTQQYKISHKVGLLISSTC